MLNGTGGGAAVVMARARPAGARWLPVLALLALALAAAGCDQFSSERVAETCVLSALKDGEPYGSDRERQETEAQLRQYCRAAAQAK